MHKFKSEFSEAERDYALGELCCEILDESKSELKNLKNRGNGKLPFELGEYLKKRCIADEMPHLRWAYQLCVHGSWESLIRTSFYAAHTLMSTATREQWGYTFACYLIRWIGARTTFQRAA